jgi:hypothetical protein
MNYIAIYDEGDGLASPFVKGKSLSQQLREERLAIERKLKQPFINSEKDQKRKVRAQIQKAKLDYSRKSAYFMKRGKDIKFVQPHLELEGLEAEVKKYFPHDYKLTDRVRFQEVVDAKRIFIFFATTYLHLTSNQIAKYLGMNRSTLSHHIYAAQDELDMYPQIQAKAAAIDNYLYDRYEQLRP